jgi:phosphohistidine swiveling domain-containing protein
LTDGELSERIRLLGETYSRFWAVYPLPVYAESWLGAEAKRFYSLFEETRAATGGVYEQAQDALAKLVSEAAARKKIPSVFALSALPNEDFASLDSSELRARFDYCVYEASEEENVVLTGARAREFTRGILVGVEEQRVLKGKPVFSRGVVRGRVARIFTLADLKAAPAGSVIVSPMTKIDFVPFLRKAKAIITDEGGITSHAAIIARELGIPCVVGVKRATDVLREGSEVEIDCDSGVVKALK